MRNILILGAGFGGIKCAKELARDLPRDFKIVLIDKNSYQNFQPALYEVATTHLGERQAGIDKDNFAYLQKIASFQLKEIFSRERKIEIMQEEVVDIFCRDKKVVLADKSIIDFEYLVLALGSETNYFGIPHLQEKSFPLKTVQQAINLRNAIDEIFYRKEPQEKISLIVGGGGFTGCEFACELALYVKKLSEIHKHWQGKIELVIIEASDNILPGAESWAQKIAQKRIKELGIHLVLGKPIEGVEDSKISLGSGEKVDYDILVWTAGVKAAGLIEKIGGITLEKGCQVLANDYLQVIPYQNIFAIGDNTHCFDPKLKKPVPATAQMALYQAGITAKNILSSIKSRALKKHIPQYPTFMIPLGGHYAIADLKIIRLVGFFGWVVKELVFLKYFLSIFSFRRALELWFKSIKLFIRND